MKNGKSTNDGGYKWVDYFSYLSQICLNLIIVSYFYICEVYTTQICFIGFVEKLYFTTIVYSISRNKNE